MIKFCQVKTAFLGVSFLFIGPGCVKVGEKDLAAKAKPFKEFLEFSKIQHAQRSRSAKVHGLTFKEPYLYTFVDFKPYYYQTKYRPDASDPLMAFSTDPFKLSDSELIDVGKKDKPARFVGRLPIADKGYLVFDARLDVWAYDNSNRFIQKSGIVIDKLVPAADSRGEATWEETGATRHRISERYLKFHKDQEVIAGIATRPKEFAMKAKSQFLVATKIEGFPLVSMWCDEDNIGLCRFERNCFLSGSMHAETEHIVGLALSAKRGLVLIADKQYNRVLAYQYQTCYQSRFLGAIHMPQELQEVSGIFVDELDRLWISTLGPDDKLNASVYVFLSKDW